MRYLLLAVLLLLAACSSNTNDTQIGPSIYGRALLKNVNFDVYEGAHDADQELVDAAHHVSRTLDDLARVQFAEAKGKPLADEPDPAKIGLADLGSVDWSGPVEPIIKQLAQASNYKLRVLGTRPAIPVLVSVQKQNASFAEIIRDIKYQIHQQAALQIYPKTHYIEIRYNKV